MARTYLPMAVDWASGLHRRLARYQSTLAAGKTTEQITALAELITCLGNFLEKWQKPPINP